MEGIKIYITDAALGYREHAILVRLDQSTNGYNYMCISTGTSNKLKQYQTISSVIK